MTGDPNLMRAQRALARLTSRPGMESRYYAQLNDFQQLLAAHQTKAAADELSDVQLDRAELLIEGLRSEVRTRKQQAELQARNWELYERELDDLSEAVEKKRGSGRKRGTGSN